MIVHKDAGSTDPVAGADTVAPVMAEAKPADERTARQKLTSAILWFVLIGIVLYGVALVMVHGLRLGNAPWVYGYFFIALLCGHLFAGLVYFFAAVEDQQWSSVLTGLVERTFFFVAVANGVGGAAVAMIGWITLKNLSYWQSFFDEDEAVNVRYFHFVVLASLTSSLFALLGGVYCSNPDVREFLEPILNSLLLFWGDVDG